MRLYCKGWRADHTRVQRIYRDKGLTQQRTRRKRHRSATSRVVRLLPGTLDFIRDQFADGKAFLVLSIVDLYTREFVGSVSTLRLRAGIVVGALNIRRDVCGFRAVVQCDTDNEFTSVEHDHWRY